MGSSGLEPPTSRLSGVRSNHLSYEPISLSQKISGGDERDRTDDPLLAKQVLSQLSYTPMPDLYIFEVSSSSFFKVQKRTLKIKQRIYCPEFKSFDLLTLDMYCFFKYMSP